jgi:hypothetical protein
VQTRKLNPALCDNRNQGIECLSFWLLTKAIPLVGQESGIPSEPALSIERP